MIRDELNQGDPLQRQCNDLRFWSNAWRTLIFVVGAAAVVFMVACILFFINRSWTTGALSTLGTIVTGTVTGWLIKRSRQTEADYRTTLKKLDEQHSREVQQTAAAQSGEALFGRKNR